MLEKFLISPPKQKADKDDNYLAGNFSLTIRTLNPLKFLKPYSYHFYEQ